MIPNRSMSYLLSAACIISTAQQAKPKVNGQSDPALAQVINDKEGKTLASASSLEKKLSDEKSNRKELAEKIGTEIAKRSIKNGVKEVAFDKGKYKYHGLIKILAEAAREAGLNF